MIEISCFLEVWLMLTYWKLSYHKRTRLDVFKGEFDDKHLSKQGSTYPLGHAKKYETVCNLI